MLYRAREVNKLMRDKAARACHALYRARVPRSFGGGRGTYISEHSRLLLTAMDRQVLRGSPFC
jgi:hypothetical protein